MSDLNEPIAFDRYRAEALALRSAAMAGMFRVLWHLIAARRRRGYPGVATAA